MLISLDQLCYPKEAFYIESFTCRVNETEQSSKRLCALSVHCLFAHLHVISDLIIKAFH